MDLEQRVVDLETRLEYQQKLCAELQHALLFESSKPKEQSRGEKRKYSKETPLKEYIQTNSDNQELLAPLKKLCPDGKEPTQALVRAYLSMMFKYQDLESE